MDTQSPAKEVGQVDIEAGWLLSAAAGTSRPGKRSAGCGAGATGARGTSGSGSGGGSSEQGGEDPGDGQQPGRVPPPMHATTDGTGL